MGKCAEKSGPMKLWQDLSSQTTQTLVIEDDQLNTWKDDNDDDASMVSKWQKNHLRRCL